MSASTIARWNAIPISRSEQQSLKPEDNRDDDDDDNVSIVSRTPSPPPDDMVVDSDHISKYDEFIRGAPREVITVETKLTSSNKGFAMLAKLGWVEGQPLGLSPDGRVDPIPFQLKNDSTGLGKTSQDIQMIETTVSQRRGLDSERQHKETEDQRKARESLVARRTALESEITSTLKAFYCALCDKQFKNVAQYDEHTNSYAHHHKARAKDMQANARIKPQEELDKRKEKERKREEKELRKIAAASGIKMPKPAAVNVVNKEVSNTPVAGGSGWVSVRPLEPPQAPQSGFKRSGWATVGEPVAASSDNSEPPRAPSTSSLTSAPPLFRQSGWTSLDTSSLPGTLDAPAPPIASPPPPVPPQDPPPVSAQPPPPRSGWQRFQNSAHKRRP